MKGIKIGRELAFCSVILWLFASTVVQAELPEAEQITGVLREIHAPILIQGNEQFTPENGVTGGLGTQADPYIIENWEINASTAHGIHIMNTTAYFVIRNCTVESGDNAFNGIYLQNVRNGMLENNVTHNNKYGVYLYDSDSNTVTGNSSWSNYLFGVYLDGSNDNTVSNNAVTNHVPGGIFLDYSDHNILSRNSVSYNKGHGIRLFHSQLNTLNRNTVSDNDRGLLCESSDYNYFVNNLVLRNNTAFYIVFSCNNFISGNTLSDSYVPGLWFDASDMNTVTENTVSNNGFYGIWLCHSHNNALNKNTASNNGYPGICLWDSNYNTLTGNTASNNSSYGIILTSSHDNLVYDNQFSNIHNAFDNGRNRWNIDPPIQRENIVGGPWLGGNYWSDYLGEDLDGDWLGDTLLPYNSSFGIAHGGDYHPLIPPTTPPNVEELNLGPIPE